MNSITLILHIYRFCPNGDFSESKTVDNEIHPNGNNNKCLDVRGAVYANGTPVQMYVVFSGRRFKY